VHATVQAKGPWVGLTAAMWAWVRLFPRVLSKVFFERKLAGGTVVTLVTLELFVLRVDANVLCLGGKVVMERGCTASALRESLVQVPLRVSERVNAR
jgi:hypothetical protein